MATIIPEEQFFYDKLTVPQDIISSLRKSRGIFSQPQLINWLLLCVKT